jgi:formylglycine-generating enzyme required for sulfatase activity
VDWVTAAKFCARLSALENRIYRLPTEAEWEYACRAGAEPLEGIGVKGSQTLSVGQIVNPWGIWDMQGNVWEWCADWYDSDYYSKAPEVDPRGPETGKERTARGGSYDSEQREPGSTRSNQRKHLPDFTRVPDLGFRVVLEP